MSKDKTLAYTNTRPTTKADPGKDSQALRLALTALKQLVRKSSRLTEKDHAEFMRALKDAANGTTKP